MVFDMKLNKEPFECIERGEKSVELRLYDEKRQRLNIGDYIIFTCLSDAGKHVAVQVIALYRYADFEDLFMEINPLDCGFGANVAADEAAAAMREYYPESQICRYGVLGIRIKSISVEHVQRIQAAESEKTVSRYFPDGMK